MPEILDHVHITVDPIALEGQPELVSRIGIISTHWTEIENELALLFGAALGVEPAVAAAVLGTVYGTPSRIKMLKVVFALQHSPAVAEEFRELAAATSRAADERNKIVHGVWAVHDDHPGALLRMKGLTDPQLTVEKYSTEAFLEILENLVAIHLRLRRFRQRIALLPTPAPREDQELFWRQSGNP